ncbi:MAG TPA: polysaccharide deacetylase family protein [Xanthobacteraceae bacterium]|nr:polysaccharide deacetylase family protein [Xanthobacteraceae bacterium]
MEYDAVARGARVLRLDRAFRWPDGRHVAVVLNVAYEGWSDGKAPGIGPMGNPLPAGAFDTNALSWGIYGATRGIERLMRTLERGRQRASVMVSGVFAERTPAIVRAIAEAGHEIVAHCYAQDIIPAQLTAEQVRADIAKTTSALEAASGQRPRGWISPRGTPSADSARLLLEAGYAWQGDVFDDDRPYVQVFDGGRIVAIPLTMEINDLPHAMRFGRSPGQYVELFDEALDHMLADDSEAVMIDVTAHAHVYGRPAGAWAFAAIAAKVGARDDIWLATRGEIAAHVRDALG